jgi:transposase-like protein
MALSAENTLAVLIEKWGKKYPSAVKVWNDNFIYVVQRIFDYPAEIRKMIYTTNATESFNSALRKVTDHKAAFPNEMVVMKILYLRTLDVMRKWTVPYPNWSVTAVSLICFGVRVGIFNFSRNVYTIYLTMSPFMI